MTKHFTIEKKSGQATSPTKKNTIFTIKNTFSTKNSLSLYAKNTFSLEQST